MRKLQYAESGPVRLHMPVLSNVLQTLPSWQFASGIDLLGDSIFMKDVWYLRHPLLSIDAIELSLRWQVPWLIHCASHNIPRCVFGSFSIFKYATTTCWTELSVQERTRAIISFVDSGLGSRILGI